MSLYAGFAEVDITPPLGTQKIGWLKVLVGEQIRDPLFVRAAVFKTPREQIAFLGLDTLFIGRMETEAIRQRISAQYAFPGRHVMIAATHNHAGPAVTDAGDVPQDKAYVEVLVSNAVEAFGQALNRLTEAEIGLGSCFEWNVAHNRRVIMRDGTTRTHGTFADPQALCFEGPIDPEVAVVAVRSKAGQPLGVLVNFACHPTHHGGDTVLSAGFPGELASQVKAGWSVGDSGPAPVTLFLNGAAGNVHTSDPRAGGKGASLEEAGEILARDARQVIEGMRFRDNVILGARSSTVDLPYRQVTQEELHGKVRGAQRFIDPAIYERTIPALVERIRECGSYHAEIQALFIDDWAFVAVPGEYFVEFGLRIKEQSHPMHALVVSCANDRVGYIPTREAFQRGGYETTFGPTSMLAPEAGGLIAETAVALVRQHAPGAAN